MKKVTQKSAMADDDAKHSGQFADGRIQEPLRHAIFNSSNFSCIATDRQRYPRGLNGEEILLEACIPTIADAATR